MDITPQEESMIKAFRETGLQPLFVLIRVRNDIANDIGNVKESQRDVIVKTLEKATSAHYGKTIMKEKNHKSTRNERTAPTGYRYHR